MADTAQETLGALETKERRRSRKTEEESSAGLSDLQREVWGVVLIVGTAILLLSLVSYDAADFAPGAGGRTANWIGPVGAALAHVMLVTTGLVALPLVLCVGAFGVFFLLRRTVELTGARVAAFLVAVVSSSILLHLMTGNATVLGHPAGGVIGLYAGEVSCALLSAVGTSIVFSALFIVSLAVLSQRSPRELALVVATGTRATLRWAREVFGRGAEEEDEERGDDEELAGRAPVRIVQSEDEPAALAETAAALPELPITPPPTSEEEAAPIELDFSPEPAKPARKARKSKADSGPRIIESEAMAHPTSAEEIARVARAVDDTPPDYELPALSLLDYHEPASRDIDAAHLRENAQRLEKTLSDFKVEGEVVQIQPGPVVTMYEFRPAPGVKISRIQNLSDDLTMALAAERVRIIAPIPGKAVVGIEVPNKRRETVYLREVISSKVFREAKSKLTIALGKDIVGNPTVADLARAPHLLVAGATGSGKSVAINAFILSILFRCTPEEVRMIMVDPKMLELTTYQNIPHLLLPVVTDPKEAATALKWAVMEMERRYRAMKVLGARNVKGYNERAMSLRERWTEGGYEEYRRLLKAAGPSQRELFEEEEIPPPEKLPYLVVIVDELADLMMVASKDVETSIARLAQMARAAGIHLILATQRPSVDVITGLIKANFPARLSFQVASKTDARTILDQKGSESLLGKGDMLFLPPGTSALQRNHGALVEDEEVRRVVDFVREQRAPEYDMDILADVDEGGASDFEDEPYDEFYDQAVAIVAETRQASISYLQRRLKIGYNRAARIVERMEREGVVGPSDGTSKPREVFVDPI